MVDYGSLNSTGEQDGRVLLTDRPEENHSEEHYSIPIKGAVETESPNSSTVASLSEESESLLERTTTSHGHWVTCSPFAAFFNLLGFQRNPLRSDMHSGERNGSAADLRLSMLSNFSTAYNILSISLALQIMETMYSLSPEEKSLCSATLIAGMIVGQIGGGILGDVLGRHRALTIVMFVQVSASLVSAFSRELRFRGHVISIYTVLGVVRFILGLGAGGVYPLAATLTAESGQPDMEGAKSTTLAFSSQGVGYLAVPVVAYLIVTLLGPSDFAWRLLLGFGALPGILLTVVRIRRSSTVGREAATRDSKIPRHSSGRAVPVSIYDAVAMEPYLIRKMLGTAGCWLLFDILFYGNTLFQPLVLAAAFGAAETIPKVAIDSTLLALLSLPGYFSSVYAVGKLSPRYIQIQGFVMMGVLYLVVAIFFQALAGNPLSLFLYGLTFFFSNFGPNCTTYILPSLTFSRACRSTLNGVCAACGKIGALIGTALFATAAERYSQEAVFVACAIMSGLGGVLTWACVSSDVGFSKPEDMNDRSPSGVIVHEEYHKTAKIRLVYSHPSLFDFTE